MHFHRFFASGRLARTKVFDIWHHQLAKFSYIRVGHRSFKSSRPFLFALVPVFSIAIFCHETPTNMKIHEEENNSSILARRKEENTGLLFNSILSLSNSAENSQSVLYELMAVGARQITFLKFNVYGIGLYATPASIADIKSKIESERESFSLQSKDRLLDEILDLQLDLTLEIGNITLKTI